MQSVVTSGLHWADYVILALILGISSAIGLYYGCKGDRQRSKEDYLLGSRSFSWLPISMSICASFMSAVVILGTAADVYSYGFNIAFLTGGIVFGTLICAYTIIPVMYPLKLISTYEYLELRFHSRAVRVYGSSLGIICMILSSGMVTYAPSTALEAVNGFPAWASIIIIIIVATFYTTIGGIKAVVWTDSLQILIMIGGILVVFVQGLTEEGGMSKIWTTATKGKRIDFNNFFDLDPSIRFSFWSVMIGGTITWLANIGVNQANVQRFCAVPTLRDAKAAAVMSAGFAFIVQVFTALNGLVVYSRMSLNGCDLFKDNILKNSNQVLAYHVKDVFSEMHGLIGLFMGSLYCGSLSSVSSAMNGMAAVAWEDIFKERLGNRINKDNLSIFLKVLVLFSGALIMLVAFGAMYVGGTLSQMAFTLFGATGGPLLGLFLLGFLCPWTNKIGAIVGPTIGLAMTLWIAIGSKTLPKPPPLPLLAEGNCSSPEIMLNLTTADITTGTSLYNSSIFIDTGASEIYDSALTPLYRISHMWYGPIGILVAMFTGTIVSLVTGPMRSSDIDDRLLASYVDWFCCFIPTKYRRKISRRKTPKDANGIDCNEDNQNHEVVPCITSL